MRRPHFRRASCLTAVALCYRSWPAVLAAGRDRHGHLTFTEDTALSPTAVAVITLTDRSPDGAGTIIGQQRIDGAGGPEIPFSVPFERDQINQSTPTRSVASVVDGGVNGRTRLPCR